MIPDDLTPEDELKAENELLKLKLEMDYGMNNSETSSLSLGIENRWLNSIFNFEKQYQNARRIKVYDAIGRPAFKKTEELARHDVPQALNEILLKMSENGIQLDCICEYEDDLIYRFVTEELFNHEMDDIHVEGMVTHFTYEEFHPNHDYDLRRYTDEFVETLILKKWNTEFDVSTLSETITFYGKQCNGDEISNIILEFQEGRSFALDNLNIEYVSFDLQIGEAIVRGSLAYNVINQLGKKFYEGNLAIGFKYKYGFWYISSFLLPGMDR